MQSELYKMSAELGGKLLERGHVLALAESCTGGWIAQSVTEIPGSSKWFDRGFITYSNASKRQMLGVSESALSMFGAVSAEIAQEMVAGALCHSDSNIALAVTGIAGPDGGTEEKPVGLVFIAWQIKGQESRYVKQHFTGNRHEVRYQTVQKALSYLLSELM